MSCAACGDPGAMSFEHRAGSSELLCSKCAARAALLQAAEDSLHAELWPRIEKWAKHWHAAGCGVGQLQAALWIYGTYYHPDGNFERPDSVGDPHQQTVYAALGLPFPEDVRAVSDPLSNAAD